MKNKQYAIYENGGKQFSGTLKQCLRIVARFTLPQDEWVITNEDAKVIVVRKIALVEACDGGK